jgi:hypothetical protein
VARRGCPTLAADASMPYTSRFTDTGSDTRFTGVLTRGVLTEALEAAAGHAYPRGRRFALIDLTGVTDFALSAAEIRAVAERAGAFGPATGTPADAPLRIAVVAAQDVGYGLARMWETLAEPRPVHTAVFRSRAKALGWLAAQGIQGPELPPDPAG